MSCMNRNFFSSLVRSLMVVAGVATCLPVFSKPQSVLPSRAPSESSASGELPKDLSTEEQVQFVRKRLLSNRPYRVDFSGVSEVVDLVVLPSSLSSAAVAPDWWSEKQGYDLGRLYAIALGYYPIFKVVPPESWDKRVLAREGLDSSSTVSDASNNVLSSGDSKKSPQGTLSGQDSIVRETSFNIDLYNFQHMPVKRRGIGLGFIAITSKQCSTETYLRSLVNLSAPMASVSSRASSSLGFESLSQGDQSIPLSRIVVDKTGGTSLNLNFLVGGAGGGNFDPPAKPLKEILLESVVDAAELTSCMAANNQPCIEYYRTLPKILPTKLTKKQKKKVGSC